MIWLVLYCLFAGFCVGVVTMCELDIRVARAAIAKAKGGS